MITYECARNELCKGQKLIDKLVADNPQEDKIALTYRGVTIAFWQRNEPIVRWRASI
jgi:hypothetical protein